MDSILQNFKPSIDVIERLLDEDTEASIIYAALECRLALERICYARLQIAHDYISSDDLKKWQPAAVVKTLIQEVDKDLATGFSLAVSAAPLPKGRAPTKEEHDAMNFAHVGTQVGFNPTKIGKLWHALAKNSLHVPVPQNKTDPLLQYGDKEVGKAKVVEALEEIKRIAAGTMISAGMTNGSEELSAECKCGSVVKRRISALTEGQVVSCINSGCVESYEVRFVDDDFGFYRRIYKAPCKKCGTEHEIPKRKVEDLRPMESFRIKCSGNGCKEEYVIFLNASIRSASPPNEETHTTKI